MPRSVNTTSNAPLRNISIAAMPPSAVVTWWLPPRSISASTESTASSSSTTSTRSDVGGGPSAIGICSTGTLPAGNSSVITVPRPGAL